MIDTINLKEIRQLFCKLKKLVPGMPRKRRLSKLEIIQNVIDYIQDLEVALTDPIHVKITTPFTLHQCNNLTHSHHL